MNIKDYCHKLSYMELVPWALYDTSFYHSDETKQITFFDKQSAVYLGNNWIAGMLPNPQAFSINEIQLFGISSNIALGEFNLEIDCKLWQRSPAWLMSIRQRWLVNPAILIPPLINFRASINWQNTMKLGKGLNGKQKKVQPIQCALIGILARPVQ